MLEIEKPDVSYAEWSEDKSYGKFMVEPLERGFGITLGNALRRILLSSLPGLAVNSIKVDGVLHEFSTIPGVVEDTTDIILAMKALRLAGSTTEPKTLRIEAEGEGEVKARDIITDPDDVSRLDFPFAFRFDAQRLGLCGAARQTQGFHGQDNVGGVLNNPWDGRKLM